MKKNTTKHALLSSLLALVLCCAMLVGTTFAWFTDSVSSGRNTIQSGNLDMVLSWKPYGAENTQWTEVTSNTKVFSDEALYEPGYTEAVWLKIENAGSLAFRYQLTLDIYEELAGVNQAGQSFNLSDYLVVKATPVTDVAGWEAFYTTRESLNSFAFEEISLSEKSITLSDNGVVFSKDDSDMGDYSEVYVLVVIQMPETVGNEANHNGTNVPTIELGLNAVATQVPHEEDSFDNLYDEDATYPVVVDSADALKEALANAKPGDVISLTDNVDYGTVTLGELTNVVLNGAEGAVAIVETDANTKLENVTLKEMNFVYTGATPDCGVVIDANAQIDNLVMDGCTFTGTGAKAGRGLSGLNNAASIVMKNCTFKDLGYPIYAWGGYESLVIDTCTFDNIKSWAVMPQSGFDGDLTVNNCDFVNCLGGGLVKAGTLTAGHTFTFTNNEITGCTVAGDHNWFQFNTSAGTTVLEGNLKDGVAWTPTAADGLK